MPALLHSKITVVWGVLIAATLTSWWLGGDHSGSTRNEALTIAVLVIAFTKVWLVGLYFMELRGAPRPLRLLFEAYVAVVCLTLAALYVA